MRTAEEIIKDIDIVDTLMIKGCYQAGRGEIDTISLRKQRESLENELCLARSVLVASNDELDVYEQRKYKEHYIYYVVLHDTTSIVGFVYANYGDGPHVIGNVGYEIYRKYRGNGYTKKALELLCDVFLDRGMEMSIIVIHPGNIASVKTTEGFGGVLVKKSSTDYGTNVYNVDIRQKVLKRQAVK